MRNGHDEVTPSAASTLSGLHVSQHCSHTPIARPCYRIHGQSSC